MASKPKASTSKPKIGKQTSATRNAYRTNGTAAPPAAAGHAQNVERFRKVETEGRGIAKDMGMDFVLSEETPGRPVLKLTGPGGRFRAVLDVAAGVLTPAGGETIVPATVAAALRLALAARRADPDWLLHPCQADPDWLLPPRQAAPSPPFGDGQGEARSDGRDGKGRFLK